MYYNPDRYSERFATRRQVSFLRRNNLPVHERMSYDDVHASIAKFVNGRRQLKPTAKQEQILRQKGLWREGMNRGEAWDLLRELLGGGGE